MARPNISKTTLPKFRPTLNVTRGLATAAEMNNLLQAGEDPNQFDTFVLQVDTTNSGTSAANQFTLPLRAGETYNFIATIDGVDQPPHTTDVSPTYTFLTAGVNTVEIRGAVSVTDGFPGLHFNAGGDALKVINLLSWGFLEWTNFNGAFNGCSNMTITSVDVVPVGTATDFTAAFQTCGAFTVDGKWDLSNATTMAFFARNAQLTAFNPTGNLDNVTTMQAAFQSTQIISLPLLSLPACTTILAMCFSCSNLTSIGGITNAPVLDVTVQAFQNTAITHVPALELPWVRNARDMFSGCADLVSVDEIVWGRINDIEGMFETCSNLTTFNGVMDFSTATIGEAFLDGCTSLVNIPMWNFSSLTSIPFMFRNCTMLASMPNFTFGNIGSMVNAFENCFALTSLPDFNGKTATAFNMSRACKGSGITIMPDWLVGACTNFDGTFNACSSLVTPRNWILNAISNVACNNMFRSCTLLETPPAFTNTDKITTMSRIFSDTALTSFPAYDYSNSTNMFSAFNNCNFVIADTINMSSATTVSEMFKNCSLLETISNVTTSASLVDMSEFANGCTVLDSIGLFSTIGITDATLAFANCPALKVLPAFVWTANTTFNSFLANSQLDAVEYDALLIAIDANTLSNGTLDGGNSHYTVAGMTARANLVGKTWVITDGGEEGSGIQQTLTNSDGYPITNSNADPIKVVV